MTTTTGVYPPLAVDAGAEAAVWNAEEASRLIVQARLLLEPLDRSWSGGTQRDGPGPKSSSLGDSAREPSDQSVGAPQAVWAEPGWAAVTQALQLVRSEGQWLVEAADRLVARRADSEGDPGHSMFLIDSDHPDHWQEPQDPPQGCLSGCLP